MRLDGGNQNFVQKYGKPVGIRVYVHVTPKKIGYITLRRV